MLLVAQNHGRARINLSQHVGAYLIDPLIEFVARLIGPCKRVPGFYKILRFKLAHKLSIFSVQVPMQLVYCIINVSIDARQRDIVRRRADIVDDRCDEFACGVRFFLNLILRLLVNLKPFREACLIRRILHFRNDHPTHRK